MEDALSQVRKEYEMLRIEFEQNLAANEQTGDILHKKNEAKSHKRSTIILNGDVGPINREMRHLITSLQNHNQQLKGEIIRYKRKLKEVNAEILKASRTWSMIHKIFSTKQNCFSFFFTAES